MVFGSLLTAAELEFSETFSLQFIKNGSAAM